MNLEELIAQQDAKYLELQEMNHEVYLINDTIRRLEERKQQLADRVSQRRLELAKKQSDLTASSLEVSELAASHRLTLAEIRRLTRLTAGSVTPDGAQDMAVECQDPAQHDGHEQMSAKMRRTARTVEHYFVGQENSKCDQMVADLIELRQSAAQIVQAIAKETARVHADQDQVDARLEQAVNTVTAKERLLNQLTNQLKAVKEMN